MAIGVWEVTRKRNRRGRKDNRKARRDKIRRERQKDDKAVLIRGAGRRLR